MCIIWCLSFELKIKIFTLLDLNINLVDKNRPVHTFQFSMLRDDDFDQ